MPLGRTFRRRARAGDDRLLPRSPSPAPRSARSRSAPSARAQLSVEAAEAAVNPGGSELAGARGVVAGEPRRPERRDDADPAAALRGEGRPRGASRRPRLARLRRGAGRARAPSCSTRSSAWECTDGAGREDARHLSRAGRRGCGRRGAAQGARGAGGRGLHRRALRAPDLAGLPAAARRRRNAGADRQRPLGRSCGPRTASPTTASRPKPG